jgi:hypothetical protein
MRVSHITSTTSLVMIVLVAGCTSPTEQSAAPAEKSKAELLIGEWKRVMFNNQEFPPEDQYTIEFNRDGTCLVRDQEHRPGKPFEKPFKYDLADDTIHLVGTFPMDAGEGWVLRIVSVTEEQLVTATLRSDAWDDENYKRVRKQIVRVAIGGNRRGLG